MERLERAEFVQFQARRLDTFFSLAQGEQSERRLFEQLAVDTYDVLTAEGIRSPTAFDPQANFLEHCPQWHDVVPPSLLERWKDWSARCQELMQRNPRLELREMMHQIGETCASASWPVYQEEAIEDWIDGGEIGTMPFIDHKGIVTPEFYSRLRQLRERAGGWLYWRDGKSGVVFLREARWQQLRRESKSTGYLAGRGRRFAAR